MNCRSMSLQRCKWNSISFFFCTTTPVSSTPAAFYLGALRKQQLASLHEDEEVQSLSSFFWDELYAFLLLCWGLALIPCCTAVWAMSL